jgi:arabinan endo-1,5-alpha-L-arabinosidase
MRYFHLFSLFLQNEPKTIMLNNKNNIRQMKKLFTLMLALVPILGTVAQEEIEITTAQAKALYKNTSKKRTSVHDPSVVWEPTSKRYYIFGSHKAGAYTTDMQNWTWAAPKWKTATSNDGANMDAFVTPAVKKVMKGGVEVDFPQFNAMEWAARTDASYNIDGNMWAPDVIWNPTMQKWCMYLSVNGDAWHSSIILLTSSTITGPYEYQGPIVISGFQDSGHSYKGTDLELVLGTQASLPSRYAVGSSWGKRWPNNIDPAAFYDEEGKLWLIYGSWSGGIWMLELDEETGLRDYNVSYPISGTGDGVTSDPYFGTKIAGGYYVSGEGPYIEHIGNYYYLFMSYGFFSPNGGYEMRVFRSENPNGPYKDALNRSAIFTGYVLNYGTGTDTRGMKLMGSYNDWGFMTVGECAQGHNSIIAAEDGRTYLVYHTKFNDGTAGHQVRVHQVFVNKNGWLVAAPFEYNGETITDNDVATQQLVATSEIPGTYQILFHKYKMDYENYEEVVPVELTLTADGKVTGTRTGTWKLDEGTSYLTLTLNGVTYNGVMIEEQMDTRSIKTIAFSATANSGFSIWGYKYRSDYALAWQLNNQKVPVSVGQNIKKNVDLYGSMPFLTHGIDLQWTSSHPTVITDYGKYYSIGLTEDTQVTLTARMTSGNYFWQQEYNVKALSEENAKASTETWKDGMVAHYTFDDAELSNSLNNNEKAQLLRKSTTALPTVDNEEPLRNGNTVHLNFGANGKESYVSMPNPLKGKELANGATISFFVKRNDNSLWDALFGMTAEKARLFMTGNLYMGYNDGQTASGAVYNNWIDINHPNTVETGKLMVGQWNLVTITFSRTVTSSSGGVTIYINGVKTTDKYKSSLNGTEATSKQAFDYNLIVDHIAACNEFCLGNGSFWGSANVRIDDVTIHDRALSLLEVMMLSQIMDRSDKSYEADGIKEIGMGQPVANDYQRVYDLQGRCVQTVKPGLYIKNGKKIFVK